ncbi:flagellar type III secretion system protein FlhB [Cereibacter sphaeroides]|jgi:flagellar biosynthetic protein FlhB|uniref:flagellar type III secretion system protein FlhB n=1 Tax=Cereibacter sphaeroides TaxID=1063 RepID=UPI00006640AA|nr:type III secretion exporter [Cereibacter sphaeroides ATCC 17029]
MTDGEEDKPHEPSQRKLEEARRKGEVPRSQDLVTAAAYAGLLAAAMTLGDRVLQRTGEIGSTLLGQADRLSTLFSGQAQAPVGGLLAAAVSAVLPLFLLPALAAGGALLAQRSLVVAPSKLAPRLERISPLAGLRNRFGRAALVDFLKSFVKLLLVGLLLAFFILRRSDDILGLLWMEPKIALGTMFALLLQFLLLVVILSVAVGLVDYLWQRFEHLRRNRMSRQELVEEAKDAEGDPHVKAQRRRRAVEIATNRMLQDVAKADVVVVNPTHYAVALRWKRGDKRAPVCVAKGVDEVAARIRERAIEAGVPIHRDPPAARALHAMVQIGEEIRPEHYQAVAAAVRFAETIRRKMKGRRR